MIVANELSPQHTACIGLRGQAAPLEREVQTHKKAVGIAPHRPCCLCSQWGRGLIGSDCARILRGLSQFSLSLARSGQGWEVVVHYDVLVGVDQIEGAHGGLGAGTFTALTDADET